MVECGGLKDINIGEVGEFRQLEAHVESRLRGRLRDFHVELRGGEIVLHGLAPTYYVKQLAQHEVMQATDLSICANEIEVV